MAFNYNSLLFWNDWPVRRQQVFFTALLGGWIVLLFLIWFGLWAATDSAHEHRQDLQRKYEQILPLAEEALRMGTTLGALVELGPMPAAQQIVRELKLEQNLTSIRPTQLGGGVEGVQILMESLDLPQMIDLLDQLEKRGGFSVLSFVLNHRMDDPQYADVQLVLTR